MSSGSTSQEVTPCTRFVQKIWDTYTAFGGHDTSQKSQLTILRATPGFVEADLEIQRVNTNRRHVLHGGVICSLVDSMGSLAINSMGVYSTGPSTEIHTTFIRAGGQEGDHVRLEGRVLNIGKTLAYTEVKLFDPQTQKLLATGTHTKLVTGCREDKRNVVFDDSGEHILEGSLD